MASPHPAHAPACLGVAVPQEMPDHPGGRSLWALAQCPWAGVPRGEQGRGITVPASAGAGRLTDHGTD